VDHLLAVNAAAGSTDREAVEAAAEVLRAAGDVEVVPTDSPEELDQVLADLGPRRLVVCGGDGSVHLAVSRLRALDRLDVPIGIVPLGTGNDLARGLGLPFEDPREAAKRLRDGRPRPMDLLVADDGRVCVNAVHAGVGADAAARAESLKGQLAAVAYPVGALLAGLGADGVRTEVVVDGRTLVDDELLMVAVCNGSGFGGGATMAPAARVDDGRLDVVAVTAVGPVARAAFGLAFARGEHLTREDVHAATGREVEITVHPDPAAEAPSGLRYDVDGELEDAEVAARTWTVRRHGWQLVR
jgi:diacylglycerol kinase family enzyme